MSITRDVVTVSGPDARKYLHGQVSQDIESLEPGHTRWTFVLAPNGRIDVMANVTCVDDQTFELDTEAGYGEALAARLDRFRIRVKVQITRSSIERDGDAAAIDSARIADGWPAMGAEIVPGETIPAETGISAMAVNFTKGCYPGQELVERMDSRGATPPRQLRRLSVGPDARPGDPIVEPASGETVGILTSVAAGHALGYVRRGSAVGVALNGPSTA